MPRAHRLDHPGARHHVMNRFAGRLPLFENPGAREMFLDLLADVPEQHGARIHGYALMSNHYHLIIEVPRGNLSRTMQKVGATFTQRFHRRFGGDGPIFRGRFHNQIVDSDAYWMQLLVYVHLNPVRAGVVRDPSDSTWTSHRAYVGRAPRPSWLTVSDMLGHFGSVELLREHTEGALPSGGVMPIDPSPSATHTEALPSRTSIDALTALAQITALLGRYPPKPPGGPFPTTERRLTAWWLCRATDLTLVEIGDVLGVSRTRARQLAAAFDEQARSDPLASTYQRCLLTPRTASSAQ